MASYTTNLNLLKKDPQTEGSDTFNIRTMLNENWDKIDSKIGNPAELWVWEKVIHESSSLGTAQNYLAVCNESSATYGFTFYTSSDVSVNVDGSVQLVEPATYVSVTYNTYTNASQLKGKYVRYAYVAPDSRVSTSTIIYVPETATVSRSADGVHTEGGSNKGYSVYLSTFYIVIGTPRTHNEYLTSPDSTTYPEDGQSGSYWYIRLGQIGGCAHIETGSYVGTGTYESSSPNSLTFGFVPKIVIVGGCDTMGGARYRLIMIHGSPYATDLAGNSSGDTYLSWSGKTVSWYNKSGAATQMNSLYTYYYTAIG